MAFRRRYPPVSLIGLTLGILGYTIFGVSEGATSGTAGFLAIYSVGAYCRRRIANWVRAVCISVVFMALLWTLLFRQVDLNHSKASVIGAGLLVIFSNVFFFIAAWAIGDVARTAKTLAAELAERNVEIQAAQAVIAEQAVLDERVHIAREVHDVVAHHVSVMGVQAGAARRVMARDPDKATEMLSAIEASSRQAVSELHRLLGFLRRDTAPEGGAGGTAVPGPHPGLTRLDALVEEMNEAGLAVSSITEGMVRPVPPSVDLSAYRVAQEALTNALKHAGVGTSAVVTLRYAADQLELRSSTTAGSGQWPHRPSGCRSQAFFRPRSGGYAGAGGAERWPVPSVAYPRKRLRGDSHFSPGRCLPEHLVTIRVLLVDDQEMVRAGFRMILGTEDDLDVVGEAPDGEKAVWEVEQRRPDVVLMDIQMPVLDGLEATRRIVASPGNVATRVLILTTFERDDYIYGALQAGASGFLLKNASPEELIHAVRVVAAGDALLAPSVTRRLLGEMARPRVRPQLAARLGSLTDREAEVLRGIASGLSNAELAGRLILGEATIKTHVSRGAHEARAEGPGPSGGLRLREWPGASRSVVARRPLRGESPSQFAGASFQVFDEGSLHLQALDEVGPVLRLAVLAGGVADLVAQLVGVASRLGKFGFHQAELGIGVVYRVTVGWFVSGHHGLLSPTVGWDGSIIA